MKNAEVAEIFRDIAMILEIKADNRFKIRAYERAAQNIEGLTEDIEVFVRENRVQDIPGVGKDLASKITEIVSTGKLKYLEELSASIPPGLLEVVSIPSIGPKTAKLFYDQLHIEDIEGLEQAIRTDELLGLPGIKEKTIENITRGISLLKKGRERMHLAMAISIAGEFITTLKNLKEVKRISVGGSLRRMKETVRDIDILIISPQPQRVMDLFTTLPQVKRVLVKGHTKSSVLIQEDVQVDLRVVENKSFGAALLYFTGSKNFNIKLRQRALKKEFKINEYGIFSTKGKKERFVTGKTEEEIFEVLDLGYIEPELREDTGEVELASKDKLPNLVELSDIKGDFHAHSTWSDGTNSILEMAHAAKKRGLQYIAITDHSQSLRVASGLSYAELKQKRKVIEKINKSLKGLRVLFGTELEIDSKGNLDYKDSVLAEFDIVIAAIHSGFRQSKEQLTNRIVKACENKHVDIIAHPTGRLWGSREACEIDFEEIFKVAKQTDTFLEINAFSNRLDLSDVHARRAKEVGAKLAIGTDSHSVEHLSMMDLGVAVARRGWLEKKDVANTLTLEELMRIKR
ncbi:DNA polymerase/3'-5' exonuclease PolX [Candidatus Omnitrophota bacterium]